MDTISKKFLSKKIELKFAIEAMTQCGASCIGCFLTPELRQAQDFWTEDKFRNASFFIKKVINDFKQKNDINEFAFNMGQGDYFHLSENQIKQVVDFLYDIGDGKGSAFITASGITNHEKLKIAVDNFYSYSIFKKQPLLIDFVLDASKLNNNKIIDLYIKNIYYIRKIFGHIDVNININSDSVKNITPAFINDFMLNNELNFLAINIVPAYHNQNDLKKSWHQIISWLNELYNIWEHTGGYQLNYANAIVSQMAAFVDDESLSETVNTSIKQILKRAFVIDNKGDLFFQQAGFGDLPLTNRNGFEKILNINDKNISLNQIDYNAQKISNSIIRSFSHSTCADCQFSKLCSGIGMIATKKLIKESNANCPLGIKDLFTNILHQHDKNNLKTNGKFYGIYVQKDFPSNELTDIEKITYSEKNISLT